MVSRFAWSGISGLLPASIDTTSHGVSQHADNLDYLAASVALDHLHSLAQAGDLRLVQDVVLNSATSPTSGRPLPVSIYLESTENATVVEQAVLELLDASGLSIEEAKPPVINSWFRLMLARLKNVATSTEMVDAMTRIEHAVEMQVLHKPQAEIDSAQAEAVAKLITALSSDSNAFIQIGSVFLIKVDGVIVVRNLSQRELAFLQRNSRILDSPREILKALEEFARIEPTVEDAAGPQDGRDSESTLSYSSPVQRLTAGGQASS